MSEYPGRPQMFANRLCRLLAKTCAANEIGTDAFTLVVNVAMVEDAKRYTGAVTFTNEQLMPICGFGGRDRLNNARSKAIRAGWLHYEPGRRGIPGRYWVTIPEQFREIRDGSCDGVSVLKPDGKPDGNQDGNPTETRTATPHPSYLVLVLYLKRAPQAASLRRMLRNPRASRPSTLSGSRSLRPYGPAGFAPRGANGVSTAVRSESR